jgi:hypothetical protein
MGGDRLSGKEMGLVNEVRRGDKDSASLTIFEYAAGVKKVGLVVEGNRRWLRLIGVVTRLGLLLALKRNCRGA